MIDHGIVDNFISAFTTNTYVYETNQSIDTLRSKIQFVIDQKGIFDFKYNLNGTLSANNSFRLWRRSGLLIIKSWDRNPVTITGKLIQSQSSTTKIEIDIKPNFAFILFSFLFGIIGFGSLTFSAFVADNKIGIGAVCLLVVSIMWSIARYTKNHHKKEFENALNLSTNDVIVKRTIKL